MFRFHLSKPAHVHVLFAIYSEQGNLICAFDSRVPSRRDSFGTGLINEARCAIPEMPLTPGKYRVNVALYEKGVLQDHVEGALVFEVQEGSIGDRHISAGTPGVVSIPYRWEFVA